MQRLASECREGRLALGPEMARLGLEVWTIDGIAHQRVANMREMNPDLVSATSLEVAGEEGGDRLAVAARERFPDLQMRDRLAAAVAHRHFLAGVRMAVDRRIDGPALPVRHPPDEGHIAPLHGAGSAMVGE